MQIVRLSGREGEAAVRAVLAELPEWFGMEASNDAYAMAAHKLPMWAAIEGDTVIGVAELAPAAFAEWCAVPAVAACFADHGFEEKTCAELHLLAVQPTAHRQGIGQRLLQAVEDEARTQGAAKLFVLTLGPSEEYEPYARTRAFYQAQGFSPLIETPDLWGPSDPCLFSVKDL